MNKYPNMLFLAVLSPGYPGRSSKTHYSQAQGYFQDPDPGDAGTLRGLTDPHIGWSIDFFRLRDFRG